MKLKIFFSWEMETDTQGFDNKNFLIACINRAIKQLGKRKAFRNVTFEFQEGLSGLGGTPRVAEVMMQRARECDIFIGDMTIVQRLGRFTQCEIDHKKSFVRLSPNANVLMEYAIAYNKATDFWNQVILVMNTVNGDVKYNAELFPFDVREERHPIKFRLEGKDDEEMSKALTNGLEDAIGRAAEYAISVHKNKFNPLMGWEEQENWACYSGKYEWTDKLEKYKAVVLGNKDDIRLIGLSGYGKTRLVVESFRKAPNREGYLYADTQLLDEKEIYSLALRVFKEYPETVLVVDNCDRNVYRMLRDLRKSSHVRTKLITIYNDPAEKQNPDSTYVRMEDVQNEVVERIFRRYRDFKDEEEYRYFLEATGGNPMIAEQWVKVLKDGNDNGRIDDADFMTKLLGCDETSAEREAMRSLALFSELEYDERKTTHGMIEYVATNKNILNTVIPESGIVNWITDIIRKQIKRGNIEKTGTTIRIRPQRLRDGLFAEWQEHCDVGRLVSVITEIDGCPYKEELSAAINSQIYSLISEN